jgi:hypothetical protein
MMHEDVDVIDVNNGALAEVNPDAVKDALPEIVTVVNFGKEGIVKVSLAAVPPTVIVVRFAQPVPSVVTAAAVEPLPVVVMFKVEISAFVSFRVKPVTAPVVRFNVLPLAPDRLLVIIKVDVPEFVTVKLVKALLVIVEFTALGSKDIPAKATFVMVDAAVALFPFASEILTIPLKIPPVAAEVVTADGVDAPAARFEATVGSPCAAFNSEIF